MVEAGTDNSDVPSSPDPPPDLSVVIPTYRRPTSVKLVVEATLQQLGPHDEVIVIDDGSGDQTLPTLGAISDPRLRVMAQENAGPGMARNRGAGEARNDVLLFLDDDEQPEPGLVAAHRGFHSRRNRCAVMGRPILVVRLRGRWCRIPPGPRSADHLITDASFSIHRSDFLAVGGFDPELRRSEDIDLGIRLIRAGTGLEVVEGALVAHHIDRRYRDFRAQRINGGRGLAAVIYKHGLDPAPSRATHLVDRLILRTSRASQIASEVLAAALWTLGRLGALVGSWRLQSRAAGRAGLAIAARAQAVAARDLDPMLRPRAADSPPSG